MSKVYRIDSIYETVYVNTAREANRCKPGGEEPESVDCLDAATECNHLQEEIYSIERTVFALRMLLEELHDSLPRHILKELVAGQQLDKFITDNPLPPAGSADRDGQRSYSGG